MVKVWFAVLFFASMPLGAQQQGKTAEDSIASATSGSPASTTIGGYGNAFYQRSLPEKSSLADLERVVLFVGHRFTPTITFFSELEVEDAKVSGGEDGGEVAFEQAYVKFDLDPDHYLTAGLFLPRIGILNESHLPTSFNGNERTQVETYVIPSTWRELGVGFYGNASAVNYSVALVNGLSSEHFVHGSGIREGRFEGRNAGANNLALTGALQVAAGDCRTQLSAYYGGTVGAPPATADSLGLSGGIFGTPVAVTEADFQYQHDALSLRLLGAFISIPDADKINGAYGNNTPKSLYGGYAEIGYDLLAGAQDGARRSLVLFARYEKLDLNASIPANGVSDPGLNQFHLISGLSYLPDPNIVIKVDVRYRQTADPGPVDGERRAATFLNLGIGYSF